MPIVRNKLTGAMTVVDDNGQPIEGAQVIKHKQTGQLLSVDSEGTPISSFNPSSGLGFDVGKGSLTEDQAPAPVKGAEEIAQAGAEKPEDNSGFFKSFYNTRIRPIIDGASDAYQRGDLGSHQAELMANGVKETLRSFVDSFPDASLRHGAPKNSFEDNINSIPVAGPMAQRMREQIDAGDYSGAIGTMGGTISPGLEPHLLPPVIQKGKELVNSVPEKLAEKTLPKIFPRSAQVLPEDVAAQATSDIPASIGQITQNANAQRLEGSHGGQVATQLADSQRALHTKALNDLQGQYFPNGIPKDVNGLTQGKMVENFFDAKDSVKKKFDDFRDNYANKNVIPVTSEQPNPKAGQASSILDASGRPSSVEPDTIQTQENIHGPIMLTETSQMSDEIKAKLDKYRSGSNFEQLPQRSKDKFNELNSLVNNLSKRTSSVVNGQKVEMPIQEWEKLKQINTDIGISKSDLSNLNLAQSQVVGLGQALKRDIQSSIENHWGGGKTAFKELEDANTSHGAFKDLFDDKLKGKLFKGNENLSRGENLKSNGFLSDPQSEKAYLNNTVSGIKNKHIINGNFTPLETNVNGTDLSLFKISNGNYILGKQTGKDIEVFGKATGSSKGIHNLAISPSYQGKGLASKLLEGLENDKIPLKPVQGDGVSKLGVASLNSYKGKPNLADPTNLYDHVAESPVIAKQFMEALGPANKGIAKGAIIGKLIEESNNPATGQFSPDAMINKLNSPGYKEIYSASERAGAENLLRQFRGSNPSDLASKGAGISNKAFHMAFPLVGLAGGIATGHMGVGLVSGVGVEMGLSTFAKRIMLNPKYARIAAQLPYQSATSSQTGLLSKSLLQALKGSSISVIMKNGDKQAATVDNEGNIKLLQ